jgi:DNA (cytosine-5)-methyltransferase 1
VTASLKVYGWYTDESMKGLLGHATRSHMDDDLGRYLFVAAYGKANGKSPHLKDFPKKLLPNHQNVDITLPDQKFSDRFKVQVWDHPASTITSHISKDGHYFIHPDPSQCRSLTVREAARIQTFPDNYCFEGGRTDQYHQVGNAVPPYLAKQLAEIVYGVLK